jgi:outer membrane protein
MKKIIFGFLILAAFSLISEVTYAQKSLMIGVVDMETVLKEMPEAISADQMLKDLQKKYGDSLVAIQNDFYKRVDQYQKQKGMMPADKQQKEEEAIKAQEQSIYKYREDKQTEIAQRRDDALEPIRAKDKKAIEMVAKEEKLDMVLNKLGEVVLFSDDKNDITYKVIDKIKRGQIK